MLARMNGRGVVVGRPQIIRSGRSGVDDSRAGTRRSSNQDVVAAVVAIISFQEVFDAVQQPTSKSERELLDAGLPVVFVVDQNGRAVAHPEASVAFSEKADDRLESRAGLAGVGRAGAQSALAPFSAVRDGRTVDMLGSYATAELDKNSRLGVIAIQDEAPALASVADMRWQVLWISLIAALLTILIGLFFANKLTHPVRELAGGAHRIASGDFSKRIEVTSRTELGDLGNSFNMMTDQIERFISDLQSPPKRNRQLFIGTVKGLAAAIDGKDPYTRSFRSASHASRWLSRSVWVCRMTRSKRFASALCCTTSARCDRRQYSQEARGAYGRRVRDHEAPAKGLQIMSQIPAMKEFCRECTCTTRWWTERVIRRVERRRDTADGQDRRRRRHLRRDDDRSPVSEGDEV